MAFEELRELSAHLDVFAKERDWDKFHTPKNLTMALSAEVGELTEIFQWLTPDESASLSESKLEEVGLELADILIYTLRLSQKLGIDLAAVADKKTKLNEVKYPAKLVYGSSKKYTEY